MAFVETDIVYELGSKTARTSSSQENVTKTVGLKDSGERQQFDTGAVRDLGDGKGRFDLVPPIPMMFLARIYEDGAKKYADRNWEKGIDISRMLESAERHIAKYKAGLRDEPHMSQALWNIAGVLFMAAMVETGKLPEKLFNLPNYLNEKDFGALSPHERESLKTFLGVKELKKQVSGGAYTPANPYAK